ncbi:hypothetical protein U1E44_00490 [Arenibacter sp. GZD96]|uniref:hypothetical protein n=1 Tax=Aurantibrevibacter litoralis TaxID=3106030 RepID=UPI002AFE4DCA|nr:hypothetical protein [Arenibacter sp. GZD-96]MEA1784556.1 hypothetical protein [Arenibacter sp. GZD-96]
MADLYIKSVKTTLKEFHRTALASDYNFLSNGGRKSLDDFYEALAWKGIKEDGVIAWNTVPELRKSALEAALQESFFVATKTCPN